MDIDRRLNPDIVSNITNIPFENRSFNLIACYEILEHLPYKKFYKIFKKFFVFLNLMQFYLCQI